MTYVISDLHGYPLKRLQELLAQAKFGQEDVLYILGDVIDRNGDGGVEMLCWILSQKNVHLILGNHEAMLLCCAFLFEKPKQRKYHTVELENLDKYQKSGGSVTLNALKTLDQTNPETVAAIFDALRQAPLYWEITVGTQKYLLLHGGLENFRKDRAISDYTEEEILWAWPELGDDYYDDIVTVFGHTPTMSYGSQYRGKILHTRTWIDIDAGAGWGLEPILLRLEDMQQFQNKMPSCI